MARPVTKNELIEAAEFNFEKLWFIIDNMKGEALSTDFDFSADEKKKESHWDRDKNLRDVLIHLYEWHQLLLKWISSNRSGENTPFLPSPYNWKTYGDMNRMFWNNHQSTDLADAVRMLKESHVKVLETVKTFSSEELFTKKKFSWTGSTTLGSYCVSATSSHYDWAIKKLKAHNKKF